MKETYEKMEQMLLQTKNIVRQSNLPFWQKTMLKSLISAELFLVRVKKRMVRT